MISAYIYSPKKNKENYFYVAFTFGFFFLFLMIMCELLNTFQYWGLRLSSVGSPWNICTSRVTVIDHFKQNKDERNTNVHYCA